MSTKIKKKIDSADIDSIKNKVYYKIFDVYKINNNNYYLDKEFNLIWNSNQDVIGIINKNCYVLFEDLDNLIKTIQSNNLLIT
jgi:hypothetical protein